MLPAEQPIDEGSGDLFEPEKPSQEAPSNGVFAENGKEFAYIGEVILPSPVPVEIMVEVNGWNYVYKLDRREKDETDE